MATKQPMTRTPLLLNAALSLLTGGLLAAIPSTIGSWLGVSIDGWLQVFGIALLGHAAALAVLARSVNPMRWVRINLAMIAPYPLAMVGIVAAGLVDTTLGRILLLADGAAVGAVAFSHWLAIRAPQPEQRSAAQVSPQASAVQR